jgi:tartrate dehydrogenase/decarboxylase/D-malate dehydrogenase
MSQRQSTAVIAGDGIGKEVVPGAIECLNAVASIHSLEFDFVELGWSSDYYEQHGRMMPVDGLEQLAEHHAIFLGAVGVPSIADAETSWIPAIVATRLVNWSLVKH